MVRQYKSPQIIHSFYVTITQEKQYIIVRLLLKQYT